MTDLHCSEPGCELLWDEHDDWRHRGNGLEWPVQADRAAIETRREAASRLRRAADAAGQPDELAHAVLTALASEIEPGPPGAIDIDGSGYMLDCRALRMARAILGEENP